MPRSMGLKEGLRSECVTVVVFDVYGDVMDEFVDVGRVLTYKHGFELIRLYGERKYYPCEYSFNLVGNGVVFRINKLHVE